MKREFTLEQWDEFIKSLFDYNPREDGMPPSVFIDGKEFVHGSPELREFIEMKFAEEKSEKTENEFKTIVRDEDSGIIQIITVDGDGYKKTYNKFGTWLWPPGFKELDNAFKKLDEAIVERKKTLHNMMEVDPQKPSEGEEEISECVDDPERDDMYASGKMQIKHSQIFSKGEEDMPQIDNRDMGACQVKSKSALSSVLESLELNNNSLRSELGKLEDKMSSLLSPEQPIEVDNNPECGEQTSSPLVNMLRDNARDTRSITTTVSRIIDRLDV